MQATPQLPDTRQHAQTHARGHADDGDPHAAAALSKLLSVKDGLITELLAQRNALRC